MAVFSKYQCGFQKGKSTTDHMPKHFGLLETYIRKGFVKKSASTGEPDIIVRRSSLLYFLNADEHNLKPW